jgi:hypothetical protein
MSLLPMTVVSLFKKLEGSFVRRPPANHLLRLVLVAAIPVRVVVIVQLIRLIVVLFLRVLVAVVMSQFIHLLWTHLRPWETRTFARY